MEGQTNLYGFNGNVLVSKDGNVIYKKSFGFADYNTKKKLDSNSIFDCGSIAKEFTAMGILLLKDKGKISYTDTLRKFFPELPYSNITIQQLLTHTFCPGGVFTACINNYKIHIVNPRRRKELPIFCAAITFILLEKYIFSNKRERVFYYKIQLVNYRWRRQFLYLKIIGVGMFYTVSCEAYSTSGFHGSFFSL